MADWEEKKTGQPYPKTTYSVDDILAEVRAMKQAGEKPTAAKPVAPSAVSQTESAVSSVKEPSAAVVPTPPKTAVGESEKSEATQTTIAFSIPESPAKQEKPNRLNSFLKTGGREAEKPAKTEKPGKAKEESAFAEEEFVPFGRRRIRRPAHALTADEVRGTVGTSDSFGMGVRTTLPSEEPSVKKPVETETISSGNCGDTILFEVPKEESAGANQKAVPVPKPAPVEKKDPVEDAVDLSSFASAVREETDPQKPEITEPPMPEATSRDLEQADEIRLAGDTEPEIEEDAAPILGGEDPLEIDDYEKISDAPTILADLNAQRKNLSFRGGITALILLLLAALNYASLFSVPVPDALNSSGSSPITYLTINLLLLAAAAMMNASVIFGGFFSLLRLKPDLDSGVACAIIASAGQLVYLLFHQEEVSAQAVFVYAPVAVLALLLNVWGKKGLLTRIRDNFQGIANMDTKRAVFVEEEHVARQMAAGSSVLGDPIVACDRQTVTPRNFLQNSYSEDPADQLNRVVAPLVLLGGLLAGVLVYLLTQNLTNAVTALVGLICISVPAAAILVTNVPVSGACRSLREYDTVLCGYEAVRQFSDINALALDAQELFSADSVQLYSIKTAKAVAIDQAILDAAAVAIYAGGPLADVFDKVIEGRRKMLPQVDGLRYEDGKGIVGRVEGRDVLVGNRQLLTEQHITGLPDIEQERRILREGTFPVYMSCNGMLTAMFVVKYLADEDIKENLIGLVEQGVTVLIRTCDPNLDEDMLCQLFELPEGSVFILRADGAKAHAALTKPQDREEAFVVSRGGLAGLARALTACIRLRRKINLGMAIQAVGAVLAFSLTLFFTIAGQTSLLHSIQFFGFSVIWSVLCLILPAVKRTF